MIVAVTGFCDQTNGRLCALLQVATSDSANSKQNIYI